MAGSRLERVGTVFTRVRDLMRSGVMKPHEKPIWFDVYAAFPPKRDPLFVKPMSQNRPKPADRVPEIFYAEDRVRAKFYQVYEAGFVSLTRPNFVSLSQRFVDEYEELRKSTDLEDDALFEETGKRLLAKGVVLRRTKAFAVAPKPKASGLDSEQTETFAEEESPYTVEEEETKEEETTTKATDSPSQTTVSETRS